MVCGALGLLFDEEVAEVKVEGGDGAERHSWTSFLTFGIFLAASGVFSAYMMTGLVDVTLPQHLERHLGPLSVTAISAVSSSSGELKKKREDKMRGV